MNKKARSFLAIIIAISASLVGCTAQSAEQSVVEASTQAIVLSVNAESPQIKDISRITDFTGRVMPDEAVYVIPKVQGEVTQINFSVGDTVNAGDILFKVDDTISRLQLQQAQAAVNTANAALAQATGATFEQQILQLESQLEVQQSSHKWLSQNEDDFAENFRDGLDDIEDLIEHQEMVVDKAYDALADAQAGSVAAGDYATEEERTEEIEKAKANVSAQNSALSGYKAQRENLMDSRDTTLDQMYPQLEAGEIQIDATEKSLELATGAAHQEQIDSINAQIEQAKIGYNLAAEQLSYYNITSPITGTIDQINVDLYGFATQQNPAFVISGDGALAITFSVPSEVAARMSEGDVVTVSSSVADYEATVAEISTLIDQNSGLFTIKAMMENAPDELMSGVSVKITATTSKSDGAVTIPSEAVYYQNGEPYVYAIVDGLAKKTNIEIGIINDDLTEVISGITTSTQIITSWSSQLTDGVAVEVVGG